MSARTRCGPRAERAHRGEAPGGFALFADCLLVGVFTALAAVPVVTGYAALVAACATVRERVVDDRVAGVRTYLRHLRDLVRAGPVGLLGAPVAVAAVLALDAVAVASGVPGAGVLTVPLAACVAATVVVGLRAAARWRPGDRVGAVVSAAARRAAGDLRGSALLLFAGAAAAAIVVVVPVTVLLIGGPLALAAVAVDGRRPAYGASGGGAMAGSRRGARRRRASHGG